MLLMLTEDPTMSFDPHCDNNSWSKLGLGLGEISLNNNIYIRVVGNSLGEGWFSAVDDAEVPLSMDSETWVNQTLV